MSHPLSIPSLILLVRHGATEWSQSGQHTGLTDMPLTDLGVAQATAVGPMILDLLGGTDPLVFSSPLRRALDTARLALPGIEPTIVDSLVEYDYGDYEGLTTPQILEHDPEFDLFQIGCPGGENPHRVGARCDSFIAKLERTAANRSVVAFTHGHLSRILSARLLGLHVHAGAALYNETASVGLINVHRGRFVLVGWNLRDVTGLRAR